MHLNRLIKDEDANVLYIAGPGHGGPALNANSYLEGSYGAVHSEITQDAAGMRICSFANFPRPAAFRATAAPTCRVPFTKAANSATRFCTLSAPRSTTPDLIVAAVVGDGEAETCPLEGSWKGNRFLNPVFDGAVLPILHLNGYKISGPTVEARTSDAELKQLYLGRGYQPYFVEGDDPALVHQAFAAALDACYREIRAIQSDARRNGFSHRPTWPMIVLRTPKGWTGPKEVDGVPIEGTFRAHQVPLASVRENPRQLQMLEAWMRSYHPEKLFDASGALIAELRELSPLGPRRMGANPHANGGRLLNDLSLPAFRAYALEVPGARLPRRRVPAQAG